MNTLKSYLESMFASMPNTAEVLRAKDELWQMMEDKYNELINQGKNENEAVGTVISEFGNLEELSDDLGLQKEFSYEPNETQEDASDNSYKKGKATFERNVLAYDDAKSYVEEHIRHGYFIAMGVMLCIFSPIFPIMLDVIAIPEVIGVCGMMLCIGAAVFLFVYSGILMDKWSYLKEDCWMIDYNTARYLQNEKERFRNTYAIRQTIGIVLCVLCWIPAMIIGEIGLDRFSIMDSVGAISLFIMVGIGVMMIVYNNMTMSAYDALLKINDIKSVSGNYVKAQKSERYINDTVTTIMSVYWPTITGIYLIWSFLSFNWHISWIIWPIAAIVNGVIDGNLKEK